MTKPREALRVIDGHAHVGPWDEPGFAGRATRLEDAAALYGALGFFGALVTATDRGDNLGLAAALRAHDGPPHFRQAWWAEPRSDTDLALLKQHVAEVAALKVHPSFLRRPLSDPSLAAYLDVAEGAGLPLVVHCGRWREVAGFELALAVAQRRPALNIVLSHMGGDEPLLVRETVAALVATPSPNVYLGTESVRQYWVVEEAVAALGARRVIFGSDYNLNHPAAFRAIVDALPLDEEGRADVLGANLNRLLPPHQRFF